MSSTREDQVQQLSARKAAGAIKVMQEMRTMLDDIARSATILGGTPFAGRDAARALARSLNVALLEYEIGLAELGGHEFDVKS
jgi:hypothetical protein